MSQAAKASAHRNAVIAVQRIHGLRALVCAVALSALLAAITLMAPSAHSVTAVSMNQLPATSNPLPIDRVPDLALLRNEAVEGVRSSIWQLAVALMDQYDRAGDSDDLQEALDWVDKGWQQFGDAGLVGRVLSRYCDQGVIRGRHGRQYCELGE